MNEFVKLFVSKKILEFLNANISTLDFFTFLDNCIGVITSPVWKENIPPEIHEFLTNELNKPQYPFMFAEYFFNRDDVILQRAALTLFNRSLYKTISLFNEEQLKKISEILTRFVMIRNQELLSFLPRTIVHTFSFIGKQWDGFYKIITLYTEDPGYFKFCSECILILISTQENLDVVKHFGPGLIHLGLFSENHNDFFSSFRILLSLPVSPQFANFYEYIIQVASESLEKFDYILFRRFWARLSNFHLDGNEKFVEIAFHFLNLEIDTDFKEILLFYLCHNVSVLQQEQVLLLMKIYIKLLKEIEEHVNVLMQHFYFSCTTEQFQYCLSFFIYKMGKLMQKGNVLIAMFLFQDILSFQPKALLPYIDSFFLPMIEKLIVNSIEVTDFFTSYLTSSICNTIDYYSFFSHIFSLLGSSSDYDIRCGCYDVIIAYGTHMNEFSGWLFPILLQNISSIPPDDILLYLEAVFATFNPSLTFNEEVTGKLFAFIQNLLQHNDEDISIKAACFTLKLMAMHSHDFSSLFMISLGIIKNNPQNDGTYDALRNYIRYFGPQYIEDLAPSIFDEGVDFLNNQSRFMCVSSLIKYYPGASELPEADNFLRAIIDGHLEFGNPSHLEMISHVRFGKYFVRFFALVNQKVRMIYLSRKDLVYGYCKIIRKMVKHLPSDVNPVNVTKCVETTFDHIIHHHDVNTVSQSTNIIVELGRAMAILKIDKIHFLIGLLLQISASGDFDILLDAMKLFEHCLISQVVTPEEVINYNTLANIVMEKIRIDIHLTQLFNMLSVFPHQMIIRNWPSLVEFWSGMANFNNFPGAKSILAAILCKYMSLFSDLFSAPLALECINEFPPIERKQTMIFVQALLVFITNAYPPEIRARSLQKIKTYLLWSPNRTKFYKVSRELDEYISQNFSNSD
ncbi:hypothetical protein TRFO_30329 [Tritrichomonas foetus]|uniref:Uncharacterized protein n=1 Tax=Tritrichomonas foetus TaxID=1144522 RepID=A0A1J4JYD2_9EUKA|nr:hypothetical protein TRFO_30329 [Tritrichomonas foetus]|eukprot:OHT02502.1 hypothetical protein TRFO_30329 [Tritrichomonas foetus]